MIVPFNVDHISASILMTHEPIDSEMLRRGGVLLAFKIDGKTRIQFPAANMEIEPLEVSG